MRDPSASSWVNSNAGPENVNPPASTMPTSVKVSTVPVTSLKADSAMTVWDTLGRSFRRSNRGMRMAGSVGARTAPTSRATGNATPNTGETTSATMMAVRSTPGKTSRPRPTAVPEITRSEMPVPPWNRMRATPMLNRSWAPTPLRGFETSPSTEGPIRAPAATSTTIWGSLMTVAMSCETSPAVSNEAEVAEDMLNLLHPLTDQGHELLRQRPPTQVLHAIPAHDLLAPPPLLLRQLQVVA